MRWCLSYVCRAAREGYLADIILSPRRITVTSITIRHFSKIIVNYVFYWFLKITRHLKHFSHKTPNLDMQACCWSLRIRYYLWKILFVHKGNQFPLKHEYFKFNHMWNDVIPTATVKKSLQISNKWRIIQIYISF